MPLPPTPPLPEPERLTVRSGTLLVYRVHGAIAEEQLDAVAAVVHGTGAISVVVDDTVDLSAQDRTDAVAALARWITYRTGQDGEELARYVLSDLAVEGWQLLHLGTPGA